MSTPSFLTLTSLCTALQEQVAGVYYLSESEYPFEVVSFRSPNGPSLTTTDVLQLTGQPTGTFVETLSLPDFFRTRTQLPPEADAETVRLAERLQQLQAFLEQHLPGVQVYRLGQRKVMALILGQLPDHSVAGLKTWVIET